MMPIGILEKEITNIFKDKSISYGREKIRKESSLQVDGKSDGIAQRKVGGHTARFPQLEGG